MSVSLKDGYRSWSFQSPCRSSLYVHVGREICGLRPYFKLPDELTIDTKYKQKQLFRYKLQRCKVQKEPYDDIDNNSFNEE